MGPDAEERRARRHTAIALVLAVALVVAGTMAPQPAIVWLIHNVPGFKPTWRALHGSFAHFNPLHVIVYAALVALWLRFVSVAARWYLPVTLAVLGVLLELLQFYVPGRTPRWTDAASDIAGIALGWLAVAAWRRWRRRSSSAPAGR